MLSVVTGDNGNFRTCSQMSENAFRICGTKRASGRCRSPEMWCIMVKMASFSASELVENDSSRWPYCLITSTVANLDEQEQVVTLRRGGREGDGNSLVDVTSHEVGVRVDLLDHDQQGVVGADQVLQVLLALDGRVVPPDEQQ